VADVLMFADTLRSPELRHEVPISIPDPFVYLERNGRRHVFAASLELPRLGTLPDIEAASLERLGLDDLIGKGLRSEALDRELVLRACREVGVEAAVTPAGFPLDVADHLRANGIVLAPDGELFERRRRAKSEAELAGIRRAQRAAEQAMDAIRKRLRGGPATCEELKIAAGRAFVDAGASTPDIVIVSHGAQTAIGHEPGFGAIVPGEQIVFELFSSDV
jgi:Xaa-Pro aminopeptidase